MTKVKEQKAVEPVKTVEEPKNTMPELSEEELAKARVEMRATMAEKFGKWINVYDEDAVQEDIDAAREKFEKLVEEWRNQTFKIAEKDDALTACELLKKWNAELNHWEKGAWRGVILFDEVCDKEIAAQKEEATDLYVDYQTLIFLNHSMGNPKGTGVADALKMREFENYDMTTGKPKDEKTVTYSSILTQVFQQVNRLQLADKMLNLYRERITIAAAGIKFDFKITELEEFKELHDAWVVSDTKNAI